MRFYCAEDIEKLAGQGKTELILDENTALTDLARDAARQLGIAIVTGSRSPSPQGDLGSSKGDARSGRDPAAKLGSRPKGCQHAFAPAGPPAQANGHQTPDGVVDQLVELVKQTARQRSGN